MKNTRLVAWFAVAGAVTVASRYVAKKLSISKKLAEQAVAFSSAPSMPLRRILVVGDSTAVGTGATQPQASVPGRMAAAHPDWLIDNHAQNGAKFEDVVGQLKRLPKRYDLVLVLAGGNDVIRLTSASALRRAVASAVRLAQAHAPVVVLMPSGNVGHAPFFPPPLDWFMSIRSKTLHAIVQQVARESGARYVRLLQPAERDVFALEAKRMHAADGLHPSNDGYGQWFKELVRQGALEDAPGRSAAELAQAAARDFCPWTTAKEAPGISEG